MNKAKEISTLWSQIKPQIGELVRLCHEIESHYEVTADAYQRGYEAAKHECNIQAEKDLREVGNRHYQKGLNDAWECARKICLEDDDGGIPASAINDIFNVRNYRNALKNFSASEAIEKIRQYEQRQEEQIQVGDEVKSAEGNIGIVTRLFGDGIYVTWTDGTSGFHKADGFEKTGKHFSEIAEVLAKMKETDNG